MRIKADQLGSFLYIHLSIVLFNLFQWPAHVVKSVDAARHARADQAAVVPKARIEVTNENRSTL
ncbi:hypothetical protein K450DRAFT_235312 [Umbelopsis ramanniana AG]|uniref:Uncharacterized protein n=1 Tax=Umbelopsis ramanniana AG TaxID=1314678 RepID=A0AAD5EBK9_UMBRA|nr:uncharacterized protein K450DRAFT_235312 [Umbelopsis ramanniana AG]KAI8580933.1 hypothetical protein K450DRAFT_235312 [Umbelopsis ramanniana AG]